MKITFTFIFFFMFSQFVLAQTLIDEYELVGSDAESAHIDNFLFSLLREPESRGLIAIYSGENNERLGNILAHVEGIKSYSKLRAFDSEKISFVIIKGKEPLSKELWLIKKGEKYPSLSPAELDLNNIDKKYLYAKGCLNCEPTVPWLSTEKIYLGIYEKVLEENKNYTALIVIENGQVFSIDEDEVKLIGSKKYLNILRRKFTNTGKIENNRIRTKIIKDDDGATVVYFYIIPKIIKNKRNN